VPIPSRVLSRYAAEADDLVVEIAALLEGRPLLTVILALGELLGGTIAREFDPLEQQALLRSLDDRIHERPTTRARVH
jgi:hypothetical protein